MNEGLEEYLNDTISKVLRIVILALPVNIRASPKPSNRLTL
jgi:hypothetical protein